MPTTAVARFDFAMSRFLNSQRLTEQLAAELRTRFSVASPANQEAFAAAMVTKQGELSAPLRALLATDRSDFTPESVFSAMALSMPSTHDSAADFRCFAELQARPDFAALFDGPGVLSSRVAADRCADAALALTDPAHSPAVREFEALVDSSLGLGRDPARMTILETAVMMMTPEQRAEALNVVAKRGAGVPYEVVERHTEPSTRLELSGFAGLVEGLLHGHQLTEAGAQMLARAFSRLSDGDRSAGLMAAARVTSFDIRVLSGVLRQGETVPYDAFVPYLQPNYVRVALPLKIGFDDMEELGALFDHLSVADQTRVLADIAKIEPATSRAFGQLAADRKSAAQRGWVAKTVDALWRRHR